MENEEGIFQKVGNILNTPKDLKELFYNEQCSQLHQNKKGRHENRPRRWLKP